MSIRVPASLSLSSLQKVISAVERLARSPLGDASAQVVSNMAGGLPSQLDSALVGLESVTANDMVLSSVKGLVAPMTVARYLVWTPVAMAATARYGLATYEIDFSSTKNNTLRFSLIHESVAWAQRDDTSYETSGLVPKARFALHPRKQYAFAWVCDTTNTLCKFYGPRWNVTPFVANLYGGTAPIVQGVTETAGFPKQVTPLVPEGAPAGSQRYAPAVWAYDKQNVLGLPDDPYRPGQKNRLSFLL